MIEYNGIEYDPYFILGVVEEDPLEHITSEYKKLVKIFHPDKIKDKSNHEKLQNRIDQFNVINECYNFIHNKKSPFLKSQVLPELNSQHTIDRKPIFKQNDTKSFNKNFENLKGLTPNDIGYDYKRMDPCSDFEQLRSRYQSDEFKISNVFDKKSFNHSDFNKMFEYNNHVNPISNANELTTYQTTDGFNAFGDVGSAAPVSSYNGILLTGNSDFNSENYTDYKQSFGNTNPINNTVPSDFTSRNHVDTPLSTSEFDNQIRLRKQQTFNVSNKSKAEHEQELLQKQQNALQKEKDQHKNYVLQYQHLYDQQTIEAAKNNKLITSPDLIFE